MTRERSILLRYGVLFLILPLTCLLLFSDLWAAPLKQVPMVDPDAVTTPVLAGTATPTPVFTITVSLGYHRAGSQAYIVQAGDTLWDVALNTGLDIATVPCAISPTFQPSQPLVISDTLTLPPADIRCHQVQTAESIESLAVRYGLLPGRSQFAGVESIGRL